MGIFRALAGAIVLVPLLVLTGCSEGLHSPSGSGDDVRQPSAAPPIRVDPMQEFAADKLAAMSLQQKIGSLLMLHYPGTDAARLTSLIDSYGLGGLILMGDNMPPSDTQLAAMTSALSTDPGLPPLIGIDQEGGTVSRLASDTAHGAEQLRALPPAATREAFSSRARLLAAAGVSVNFGIVADVTADPGSFLFDRVLGTDTGSSSVRVAAAVAGEHGKVLSTLKHFPGHGAAPGDSHSTVPVAGLDYQAWLATVAPPFQTGISSGAEVVMFGHLA
jgi:beta-N-acetylhexosaminidase